MASDTRPLIVVVDTNVLYDDVEAQYTRLRAVLAGVKEGDFGCVVPRVVLDELEKQYPRRIKKAAKAIGDKVREQKSEFSQLGVPPPAPFEPARDGPAYRARLRDHLEDHGVVIRDLPVDLSPAAEWAVSRRKPFKETGDGFPDAVIWLTVIEVALEHPDAEVILVSANTKDFGDKRTPVGLAQELRADLVTFGVEPDRARLVPGLDSFLDRVARPLERARVQELASELLASGHSEVRTAIEAALDFKQIAQKGVDVGLELEEDPVVVSYSVEDLELQEAAELPDGRLQLDLQIETELTLEFLIAKPDAYGEDLEELSIIVTDWDYNDHYVEASASVVVLIDADATIDRNLTEVQVDVDLGDVSLAPVERAFRAFRRGRAARDLEETLKSSDLGVETAVEDYIPDVVMLSDLGDATLDAIASVGKPSLEILDRASDGTLTLGLTLEVEGVVTWSVPALDPQDTERLAGIAENIEHGGGFVHGVESFVPLDLEVVAELADDRLREVEIQGARLQKHEIEARTRLRDRIDPVVLEQERMLEAMEKELPD